MVQKILPVSQDETRKQLLNALEQALSPRYQHHINRENWTIEEAACLGSGLEPLLPAQVDALRRFCNPDDPEHEAPIDSIHAAHITEFLKRHQRMVKLRIAANFALKDGALPSHLHKVRIDSAWTDQFRRAAPVVLPGDFVAWALEEGADLPEKLLHFAKCPTFPVPDTDSVQKQPATTNDGSDKVGESSVDFTPPPLSPNEFAVLKILAELPAGQGMKGPQIITALDEATKDDPEISTIDISTLTGRIVPFLKENYGVDSRPRIGYYVKDPRKLPPM